MCICKSQKLKTFLNHHFFWDTLQFSSRKSRNNDSQLKMDKIIVIDFLYILFYRASKYQLSKFVLHNFLQVVFLGNSLIFGSVLLCISNLFLNWAKPSSPPCGKFPHFFLMASLCTQQQQLRRFSEDLHLHVRTKKSHRERKCSAALLTFGI